VGHIARYVPNNASVECAAPTETVAAPVATTMTTTSIENYCTTLMAEALRRKAGIWIVSQIFIVAEINESMNSTQRMPREQTGTLGILLEE
jgi:hypothetical protein